MVRRGICKRYCGPSLNIGEFSQVGDLVQDLHRIQQQWLSVMVIDPGMNEEVKVTVVATGLGDANAPSMVVDNSTRQSFSNGPIDYEQLDRPSYTCSNQDLKAPVTNLYREMKLII